MRRFIIKNLFLLLPVLAIVVFCEVCHRIPDNDYKYKYRWLSQHAPEVQILSLGSSHGLLGIDPTRFDKPTFNAAHFSQDIHYDEFIFDSFFDRMDSLKCLILPISYFSPWSRLEDGEESWRVKNYYIYYHYPSNWFSLKYNLELYAGLRPQTALPEFLGLSNHLSVTELGKGTSYKKTKSDDLKESGTIAAQRHTLAKLDVDKYQANLSRVRRMIEKCRGRQVTVLLLTTPAFITYRENLNETQLSQTRSFCQTLQSDYDNVQYIDMLDDSRFGADDFYDADHLNEMGGGKLSCILNQLIMELINK